MSQLLQITDVYIVYTDDCRLGEMWEMCVASDVAADNDTHGGVGGEVCQSMPPVVVRRRSQVTLAVAVWLSQAMDSYKLYSI